jgi:hypothetical protein
LEFPEDPAGLFQRSGELEQGFQLPAQPPAFNPLGLDGLGRKSPEGQDLLVDGPAGADKMNLVFRILSQEGFRDGYPWE